MSKRSTKQILTKRKSYKSYSTTKEISQILTKCKSYSTTEEISQIWMLQLTYIKESNHSTSLILLTTAPVFRVIWLTLLPESPLSTLWFHENGGYNLNLASSFSSYFLWNRTEAKNFIDDSEHYREKRKTTLNWLRV